MAEYDRPYRRFDEPWDAHELTFCCFQRRAFLMRDRSRGYFVDAVRKARENHSFEVWAYVLMPEHVHLLIWPREEAYSISDITKSIKQSVARTAIAWLRRENPSGLAVLATGQGSCPYRFWLDGAGYDRNIRKADTLRSVIDYIHNNPVRRGLVDSPEKWCWSSFCEWEYDQAGPISLDKESCLRSLQ